MTDSFCTTVGRPGAFHINQMHKVTNSRGIVAKSKSGLVFKVQFRNVRLHLE